MNLFLKYTIIKNFLLKNLNLLSLNQLYKINNNKFLKFIILKPILIQ